MAQYTLFIGSKRFSSWSLRPWLALKMAGVAFEEAVIAAAHVPRPRPRSPACRPRARCRRSRIGEDGASHMVWDSLAICETLAERHPEANLWPRAASALRAKARSIVAEMHAGFPELRKALSDGHLAARLATPAMDESLAVEIARIAAIWTQAAGKARAASCSAAFPSRMRFTLPWRRASPPMASICPAPAKAYADAILALPPMQEWAREARAEAELP